MRWIQRTSLGLLLTSLAWGAGVGAEPLSERRISDVRNTKHNLGVSAFEAGLTDTRTVTASAGQTTEICVFCHTPHAGTLEAGVKTPLWNRQLSSATYTQYDSRSIQANIDSNPGGASKLCLSCHDGTLAIDSVNVLNGQANGAISLDGVEADGSMPGGTNGENSGFTRRLGTDLRNDHPISVTYNAQLATHPDSVDCLNVANCDGEMLDPSVETHIGERAPGVRPDVPLEDSKVQCTSCHDPHVRGTGSDLNDNIKFLRLNRFQTNAKPAVNFNRDNDIVCLSCHDKAGWEDNAHARDETANEEYRDGPAALRDFPLGTKVWQAGCLNCHDTHTVNGARRLLREGVEGGENFQTPVAKPGGVGAVSGIEETCYQCHTTASKTILKSTDNQVPDIETDFTAAGNKRMPITDAHQQGSGERHDIKDADFTEDRADLGQLDSTKRHVECTDCHNPHRVAKTRVFNIDPDAPGSLPSGADPVGAGTHDVSATAIASNIASGVLRGAWGVEPDYCAPSSANTTFEHNATKNDTCIGFDVKRGDFTTAIGGGGSTDVNEPYLTREYQICLKCHSNYGFGTNPPSLGDSGGGTAVGTNGFTASVPLTNQAMEFRPADPGQPTNAQYTGSNTDTGAGTQTDINYEASGSYGSGTSSSGQFNHRSWHPVIAATGRSGQLRGNVLNGGNGSDISSNWVAPFDNAVGTQTMYCTDCHGNNATNTATEKNNPGTMVRITPDAGKPWGPHGSSNEFILKGSWNVDGALPGEDAICFKCHREDVYRGGESGTRTGFYGPQRGDLHSYHQSKFSSSGKLLRCTWCHVAVPHGWKNKALLVNLNDVGPEAGFATVGNEICKGGSGDEGWGCTRGDGYDKGPYYVDAFLKVRRFAPSGRWMENDCGSANNPDGGKGIGKTWMQAACADPN